MIDLLQGQGQTPPSKAVHALIDTGASHSVIHPSIAEELKLRQTGFREVSSVHDRQVRPEYYGRVVFPWGKYKDIPLIACEIAGCPCLNGRDIMQHWSFTMNGPDGFITICD